MDLSVIALIGYGEVGTILAEDLRANHARVVVYDRQLDTDAGEPMRAQAAQHGVVIAASHAEAARGADLVISAVTASQTVAVAAVCAPAMKSGAYYLDFNSASPNAKRSAAALIDMSGGRYVEAAVMTSVPPYRIKVPMLLGGPHADALLPALTQLGFAAKVASEVIGKASATKMCRSVMIKGFEAMVVESLTTARAHGVEDQVLASLKETFPGIDWDTQCAYFFQRVIAHGRRRAEEMHEAAATVNDVGLTPWSASGTAERQAWLADLADRGVFGARGSATFARSSDWRVEADRILTSLGKH